MERNLISQHQTNALKLEALRAYFDFREGRPTAETVADKLDIPVRTVREWLGDNRNGELLDEIVPLWPNIGSARQFASDHVPEALQVLAELMRSAKSEKVRLDATSTLLALAGVRPAEGARRRSQPRAEQQRPAVLLNLFLGGGEDKPIRVIEGQAREVGAPVRLAGEAVRAIAEPGSGRVGRGFGTGFREWAGWFWNLVAGFTTRVWKEERLGFAGAFLFPVREWPLHVCWIGRQCERHVEPPIYT